MKSSIYTNNKNNAFSCKTVIYFNSASSQFLFLSDSLTPESLRWLLVKGKMKEAEKLYRKIARVNGKELPEEELEIDTVIDAKRLGDFRDLFKTKVLTKTTLISCFCW